MEELAPGRIDVIENKDRRAGEPDRWLRVYLIPEEGMANVQAFFTPEEVLAAIARVAENLSDLGGPEQPQGVLDRIQRAINDYFRWQAKWRSDGIIICCEVALAGFKRHH
jgi:hypothetical protein